MVAASHAVSVTCHSSRLHTRLEHLHVQILLCQHIYVRKSKHKRFSTIASSHEQQLTQMIVWTELLCFLICSTLCDPYLNLFRGLIPPIGGTLDLSPILALVVLDVSCLSLHHAGSSVCTQLPQLEDASLSAQHTCILPTSFVVFRFHGLWTATEAIACPGSTKQS